MIRTMVYHRKNLDDFAGCALILLGLAGRLIYLMCSGRILFTQRQMIFMRERDIKAVRGKILDARRKYSGR